MPVNASLAKPSWSRSEKRSKPSKSTSVASSALDVKPQQRPHGGPQRSLPSRSGKGTRIPKHRHLHHHDLPDRRPARKPLRFHLKRRRNKEPKASLARDTAHSRPHKTIKSNDFDIYKNYEDSIRHVLKALNAHEIKVNPKTYLADARRLSRIPSSSIDAIITSPPYLNAIDYMRGHKFSLIWFGYNLAFLRSIRSTAIGSEAALRHGGHEDFGELLTAIGLSVRPGTL